MDRGRVPMYLTWRNNFCFWVVNETDQPACLLYGGACDHREKHRFDVSMERHVQLLLTGVVRMAVAGLRIFRFVSGVCRCRDSLQFSQQRWGWCNQRRLARPRPNTVCVSSTHFAKRCRLENPAASSVTGQEWVGQIEVRCS